jgi:DNA-binding transcriptional LysR family regulator
VSSALGRLRHITGDALFVREGNRMVPTVRAQALSGPLRSALRQMEDALASVVRFDPKTATDTFRIIGSDYFSALLMPGLVQSVQAEAPGVTVQMLDVPTGEIVSRLSDGSLDLAVDAQFEVPDWICTRTLHRSFIVTALRRGHPALAAADLRPGQRIPTELYCAIPQVFMSMDGSRTGTVDGVLAEHGLTRRVAMTVPHFQAVALAVAEAGLLGNLPVHYAKKMASLLELDLFLPPFDPPLLDCLLFWHRRRDGDTALVWLRDRIAQVLDLAVPDGIALSSA